MEYRLWDPFRSKAAAAILKGLKEFAVKKGTKILYLGIASGTTASYLSDIIGREGFIYGVEFAPRVIRELLPVAEKRGNIAPILADARTPQAYTALVEEVDLIYADVAQPNQAEILADNADVFLKKGGYAMLAIKAASIDVTKPAGQVFKREIEVLKKRGFEIIQALELNPFDKQHAFVLARYKG